ncbi:HDOD domain-containing protein [Granulicella sibirica]|nr:HDOD domain-containing protein [Granulicella sibirica]
MKEAKVSQMQDDQFLTGDPTIHSPGLFIGSPIVAFADPLPDVPAMVGTKLQLELLLQESLVDLSAVSEVILSDAGATLQVLRLIGEEYPEEEGRPTRIEDCIVSLNSERWYEAICASSIPQDSEVLMAWQHCRRVAQCAKELAQCVEGFSPEEAYVVGLLYELGRFPHLLGWNRSGDSSREHRALGVMLADYWHLPGYLLSAIQDEQEAVPCSRWSELLAMAQTLVARMESRQAE